MQKLAKQMHLEEVEQQILKEQNRDCAEADPSQP